MKKVLCFSSLTPDRCTCGFAAVLLRCIRGQASYPVKSGFRFAQLLFSCFLFLYFHISVFLCFYFLTPCYLHAQDEHEQDLELLQKENAVSEKTRYQIESLLTLSLIHI